MKETLIHTHSNSTALDDIEATSGVCYYGVVTAEAVGLETTSFYCSGLSGWGDDDFIHLYYVQIRRTTDRSAPEYQVRRISDYDSDTGQFTVDTAFTANVNTGDVVNIIHESLKEMMDSPSLELDFAQSQSGSVEEGGYLHFHVGMVSKDSGNIAANKINIGSSTLVLERQRGTGAFSNVGITQPSLYKAAGRVYSNTRYHKPEWTEGDMYKLTLSTITCTIDGETGYVPTFVWSGKVCEANTSTQSLFDYSQSPSGTVEENGMIEFNVSVLDKLNGPIGSGSINISAATIDFERQRGTGGFDGTGITDPTLSKADGEFYMRTRFHAAEWQMGDMYRMHLSGVTVTIDDTTITLAPFVWSGTVLEMLDLQTTVEDTNTKVDAIDGMPVKFDMYQSPSGTVEEGGMIEFQVGVLDKATGPLGSGLIDISGGTITFERQRGTGGYSGTGITNPTISKADGEFYCRTRFHPTEWQAGDMYRFKLDDVDVTIGTETITLPPITWSGTVLEMADLNTKVDRIDDNATDIKGELEDLSEAPQIKTSLEDLSFLERPQSGDEYVRVEVKFRDLDGDMADPYTNVLAIAVLNSASTSRTALCYKDVAGVAQLDLVGGAGPLAAFRELERTAQGLYYFFYKVTDNATLEELIANFGWTEAGLYYEDTEYSYHTVGFQIVSQISDPNQERDYETTEDLNQAASTYDLFTATGGDVKVNSLIIRMPNEAAGGAVTSISVQTDTTTAHDFITSTQGAVANLTAEAELAWEGKQLLKSGEKIQLTIGGGAHGTTYTTEIHVDAEPLDAGAYLA